MPGADMVGVILSLHIKVMTQELEGHHPGIRKAVIGRCDASFRAWCARSADDVIDFTGVVAARR